MCDSFPAISAEQLTKAVNLAAAGTLSALNGTGEDLSEQEDARDKQNAFGNDPSKEVTSMPKFSIRPMPGSPQIANNICREDMAPSTSFYGRARKISTKKKASEERQATSSVKTYSSRKNYKLAPPLIPNGIRNVGAQVLLNPQVVKISHASSNNVSSHIQTNRGISATHSVRPITLIHTPQLPQNFARNPSEPSSLLSTILQSPPRELLSPQASSDFPIQKLHADEVSKKIGGIFSSSPPTEPLTIATTQIENKPKSSQLIPLTKSDSVFRVPFPVTFTQTSTTPNNALQIVRLGVGATNLNSNNLGAANVGSSNPPLSIVPSNQVYSQIVLNKEKPKSSIDTTLLSQFPFQNKAPLSPALTVCVTSAGPSHVVTSPVVSPKCLNASNAATTMATLHHAIPCEKTGSLGTNASSIISLPHPINLSSLTHQLIPPVEKPSSTSAPYPVKSLSSPLTQNTSRYVSIRPNLILPKECKMTTMMSPNSQIRPVFIVTSANSMNVTTPSARIPSNQQATLIISPSSNNPGTVILPPVSSSIPVIQSMTQSLVPTTTKLLSHTNVKNPITRPDLERETSTNATHTVHPVTSQTVHKPFHFQTSLPVSSSADTSVCQTSTSTHPSCQTLNSSSSVSNLTNVTKGPVVNFVNSAQSVSCCVSSTLPSSQTILSNSLIGSTHCVPSPHSIATSGFSSIRDKSSQSQPTFSTISSTSPGSAVIPRMPLTVVKDPFSPRVAQNKGSVRLTVYPLPPGFNISSSTSSTTASHSCHSHSPAVPSSTGLASKPDKDKASVSISNCQSQPTSVCHVNLATATVPVSNTSPLTVSSNISGTISGNTSGSGRPKLGESLSPMNTNTNGRKLVISPAGITQLQSLLKKMGTKEGYFIISTPRSAPGEVQQKSMSPSGSTIVSTDTSPQPATMSAIPTSNMKPSNVALPSSCVNPVTLEPRDVHPVNINSSPNISISIKDDYTSASETKIVDVAGKDGKHEATSSTEAEAMSDVESEAFEVDSDDDTSSSGDSTCSSNALVIETNESGIDSLASSSPTTDLDDVRKSITSSPKDDLISIGQPKEVSESLATENKVTSVDMNNVSLDSNITSPLSLNEIVRQHHSRFGLEYQPLYSPPFSTCKETVMPTAHESTHTGKTDKEEHNANSENAEIRFPVPESPLGISSLLRQHQQHNHHNHHHLLHQHQPQPDSHQPLYEQSLNTPHTLYTHHDQINDVHMHNSSDIEAAMNLQRLSECPDPPLPISSSSLQQTNIINASSSNSTNVTSPKSPLSINSSHPVESHTPLHPPMTPNTMLINLLNRVPTPLLTNHQDLLSVPSSQENNMHFQGTSQSSESDVSTANKELRSDSDKNSTSNLRGSLVNSAKDSSSDMLYNDATSHSALSDNTGSFGDAPQQNALDLIASNYLPSNRKEIVNALDEHLPAFSNSVVSSQNFTLFSTSWHQGNNNPTFSNPEYNHSQFNANVIEMPTNVEHTLEKADHSSSHCNSCCLPITITVNLDANNVSVSNVNSTSSESHQTITEPHHELTQAFGNHHDQLAQHQQQQCVPFDNFTTATNNTVHEKCRDAEIIRHLIMNTGTKSAGQFLTEAPTIPPFDTINQSLQNCHFEQRTPDSFIPSDEVASSNLHCSVSESNSQFGPASFHQRMSMSENLTQENCHENFSNLNSSESLMYDNNSSYETVQMEVSDRIENCSFSINSSTSETTFITSANSVFDSSQNSIFINAQNSADSSFIMPSSLSDIHSSFDTETTNAKEQMSIHHPSHIQPDGKLTRSSEFTSNIEQNELFFHQSSTSESHPNNLHLYDMTTLHNSSHEMGGYSISGMETHENQLRGHQECLQSSHCSDIQPGLIANQCEIPGSNKQLQDHPFDFSIQQSHQFSQESVNQTGSDASVVAFSDNQTNLGGYINESFSNHFYTNSAGSNIPMFSQQCAVGSEAPLMDSNNLTLNCSQLPSYKNTASDIQMEFHYQPQDDSTTVVEKQLVLPSASFSPPSVADPAVTPDPGAMEMYNGSFQNLSAYDTYLRGGQSESRAQLGEPSPESGKFCVECNIMYKNQCKFHPCDCNDISDAPILSHARLTLPPCLKLGMSEVAGHTNNTGVFAKEAIALRTKFGPLVGSPVSCDQLGSTRSFSLWQTFVASNVKVIDTSDENSSNWLMFVKPACVSSEQNLVAFQHGNRVYFVTRAEVKEGQELRYWFSKDYARMLGISSKPKNAQHQLCPHCPVCKQVFADRKQVRSHIRIQHPKPQVNKCSHCSKRFSQVSHLNAHVLAVHMNVKKFVCEHCNKRFGDSSNLRKHIKSHSDERNFKCQICSKAFRQKAHLQVHMNSHMPVKHEQCRFCGNRFTRAFERKQHELQHTKQNRIECQQCDKVFFKQKIFKEHMKIHTNERNFPCSHCGKAFRNKFALTRHGPTCKQRKRGLSLVSANSTTNHILLRHLGTSSSPHASPIAGSSTTDFSKNTTDEDLSMASSSSSVSSSGMSSEV